MKKGEDIKLNSLILAKLYYSLNHYSISAINLSNLELKKIKIVSDDLSDKDLNIKNSAGTGISCGVDSFSTVYDYINCDKPFKIGYYTFFNVGSHGDNGGEKARDLFNKRFNLVKSFAKEQQKDIIKVDSNISELLDMNFQQTHTLRSIFLY